MAQPYVTTTFHGQVLFIMFETSTDLQSMLPPQLRPRDPHRGFVKVQRLKMRGPSRDQTPPAFTHYQQIGVSTLAGPPGDEPRHRNLLLWEDRHWALSPIMQKRYGSIEMTTVFETERAAIGPAAPLPFFVDVETSGHRQMRFEGLLDGQKRVDEPAYNGFYVGGEAGSPLLKLSLEAAELTRPLHGHGRLEFGAAPHERSMDTRGSEAWPATLLTDIRVEGCVFFDLMFQRAHGREFTPVAATDA